MSLPIKTIVGYNNDSHVSPKNNAVGEHQAYRLGNREMRLYEILFYQ